MGSKDLPLPLPSLLIDYLPGHGSQLPSLEMKEPPTSVQHTSPGIDDSGNGVVQLRSKKQTTVEGVVVNQYD